MKYFIFFVLLFSFSCSGEDYYYLTDSERLMFENFKTENYQYRQDITITNGDLVFHKHKSKFYYHRIRKYVGDEMLKELFKK